MFMEPILDLCNRSSVALLGERLEATAQGIAGRKLQRSAGGPTELQTWAKP